MTRTAYRGAALADGTGPDVQKDVSLLADAGYQGLSAHTAGAVVTPRRPGGRTRSRSSPPSPRHTRPNAGLTRRSESASSTASAT